LLSVESFLNATKVASPAKWRIVNSLEENSPVIKREEKKRNGGACEKLFYTPLPF
jgi:hypothetical protein